MSKFGGMNVESSPGCMGNMDDNRCSGEAAKKLRQTPAAAKKLRARHQSGAT